MKFNVALEVTCYLLYEELPVSFFCCVKKYFVAL